MRDLSNVRLGLCLYCWRPDFTRPISGRDSICQSCDRRRHRSETPFEPWESWQEQIQREATLRAEARRKPRVVDFTKRNPSLRRAS